MTQLFPTTRRLEQAAEQCLPMLDTVLRSPRIKGQARVVLKKVCDRLHSACEDFELSEFVDDEGGPYVKIFDALSYCTCAAGQFDPQRNLIWKAQLLLESVARI